MKAEDAQIIMVVILHAHKIRILRYSDNGIEAHRRQLTLIIVDDVDDIKAFFAGVFANAPSHLLRVQDFGQCRPCHDDHFSLRRIPALGDQLAREQKLNLLLSVLFEDLLVMLVPAVYGARSEARCRHHFLQFFRVAHIDAEYNSLLEEAFPRIEVLLQCPNNQLISRLHDQRLFEVRIVVVLAVIADRGQIHIGEQPVAADIRDHVFVDCFPQCQICFVVAKNILQLLLVQPLRRRSQSHQVLGCEVLQCFGTVGCLRMLSLIKEQVVKIVRRRTVPPQIGAVVQLNRDVKLAVERRKPALPVCFDHCGRHHYEDALYFALSVKLVDIFYRNLRFPGSGGLHDQRRVNPALPRLAHLL